MTEKHALGVLLVHGIGEQPRGDTLLAFGEPMIDALSEWVHGRELGRVTVTEAKLSAARLESSEPAHALVGLALGDRSTSWLLAESWWAGEFRRPPFTKLAGWLLTVGPWAIISHASRWLPDAPRAQLPYQALKVVLSIPLSWLMQIVVVLLAVLAWLPIPGLRRAISGLLLRLTGTLGDSYVLLESPVQKTAAIRSVQRDVAWLAERCDTVAVVAHSQGAAIARLALAESRHPRVCLLVTFGSGVSKLTELESLETGAFARIVRTFIAVSFVALALLPRGLSLAPGGGDGRSIIWTLFLVMPLALLGVSIKFVWDQWKAWPERARRLSISPLSWVDFWATSDPVPNGPLARPGVVEKLCSVQVTNRISWFSDHSSYWENRDEFVLPLLDELGRRAGMPVLAEPEPDSVRTLARRRARVWCLVTIRTITALSAIVAVYALRGELAGYGRDAILRPLTDGVLTGALGDLLTGLGWVAGALLGPLTGWDARTLQTLGHSALGASIPVGIAAAWYRFCALPVWAGWNAQTFRWRCRPERIPPHAADRYLRGALFVIVGLVPLVLAGRAVYQTDYRGLAGDILDAAITIPVTTMAALFVLGLIVRIVALAVSSVRWALGLATRSTRAGSAPAESEAHSDRSGESDPRPPAHERDVV
jgi:hypothetical protein